MFIYVIILTCHMCGLLVLSISQVFALRFHLKRSSFLTRLVVAQIFTWRGILCFNTINTNIFQVLKMILINEVILNVWLQVVVLRVPVHCRGCERKMRKHISRMEGMHIYFSVPLNFFLLFVFVRVGATGHLIV